jgi:hypothetical protein
MAFELSFSPEFFIAPHDLDGVEFDKERPVSVYQAIKSMSDEDWKRMVEEVFEGVEPGVDQVMSQIQETDTCRDLRSPVEVYIDEEGYHSVRVYDGGAE